MQDWPLRLARRPKAWSAHMAEVAAGVWSRLGKAWWVFAIQGAPTTTRMLEHAERLYYVDAVKQVGWPGVLPTRSH